MLDDRTTVIVPVAAADVIAEQSELHEPHVALPSSHASKAAWTMPSLHAWVTPVAEWHDESHTVQEPPLYAHFSVRLLPSSQVSATELMYVSPHVVALQRAATGAIAPLHVDESAPPVESQVSPATVLT
jgi:hypothetical protein